MLPRGAAVVLLAPLIVLSERQSLAYRDATTLWTRTVALNPQSWMVHENLGQSLEADRKYGAAQREYVAATKASPGEADAWWRLAEFESSHGDPLDAEADDRKALAADPNHLRARFDLARMLLDPHRPGGADVGAGESELVDLIRRDPTGVEPHVQLGLLMLHEGQRQEASVQFATALRLDPSSEVARRGLREAAGGF